MRFPRLAAVLIVLLIGGEVSLGIFSCGCGGKLRLARRAAAEQVLAQAELAIEQYQKAWGSYPPDDGFLRPKLRRGLICEFFPAEDVAAPDAWDLRYRQHPAGGTPPYDLWIVDAEGVEISLRGRP